MTDELLWMIMPVGSKHGWGVCGKYLALEMSHLTEVNFVTDDFAGEVETDPEHFAVLSKINTPPEHLESLKNSQGSYYLKNPVLQTIQSSDLKPWHIIAKAPKIVGYTFFEKTSLDVEDIIVAKDYFNWIVAGSKWCGKILKDFGIDNCSTIIQGIDPGRFHTGYAVKERFQNNFVIFSGGKIEYRKGQDLVIRAFKVLQDKYDDVLLVNCWYNPWDSVTATMAMSPYIKFEMPKGNYLDAVKHLLRNNGVDPEKVIILPPIHNSQMARIYRDTDCGLFPNRCEGGTNLVLMEYMACGKPVIASYNTGQIDVLSDGHAILLKKQQPLNIVKEDGEIYANWHEPDLDEVVFCLEWAYQNRDKIKDIGLAGSKFISRYTWAAVAKKFYNLMLTIS